MSNWNSICLSKENQYALFHRKNKKSIRCFKIELCNIYNVNCETKMNLHTQLTIKSIVHVLGVSFE